MPILKPASILFTNPGKGVAQDAVSFIQADAAKKVTEMSNFVTNTFSGPANFKKPGANSKTFQEMHAAAAIKEGVKGGDQSGAPVAEKDALTTLSGANVKSTEASATASQINAATGQKDGRSLHKVKLTEKLSTNTVVFEVLPEINEQHTIEYEALAPPQFPGAFQKYKGNSSTQWQLNIMFISRTRNEAAQNYKNLLMLRAWTKPYYGNRTGADHPGKLGAPPPVLMMSGLRNLIGPVPVVITSLNWTWQRDVDYISTGIPGSDGQPIPFPTILSIPIQLVESYSIDQFNQFSLTDYRAGRLGPAFNISPQEVVSEGTSMPQQPEARDQLGRTAIEVFQDQVADRRTA